MFHRRSKKTLFCLIIFIVLFSYVVFAIVRPTNPILPEYNQSDLMPAKTVSKIVWPSKGESAVGVLGTNILESTNPQTPLPTASTAKLLTSLMVLRAKPLNLGEQGPLITITPSDVAIYNSYVAEQGSVVQVTAGEQISEYQMLQTMLLPSANNMADSLAIWAYGSLSNYTQAANSFLVSQGLTGTHIGTDASGFLPTTTSTPIDLVKIAEFVMKQPVLTEIVGQSTASGIPIVGNIKNVNYLLGQDNIIGVKTGNTDQAGGVYVSAALDKVGASTYTIITANMGAPNLADSVSGSLPLIKSAQANIYPYSLLLSNQTVAKYYIPWDKQNINVVSNQSLTPVIWGGSLISINPKLRNISYPASKLVGNLTSESNNSLNKDEVAAVLAGNIQKPSIIWKLLHP